MEKSIYTWEYGVFAGRLKAARLAAGLKQAELAERLDKTHSYVSRIENKQIRVDVIELRQICQALGISYLRFLEEMEAELVGPRPDEEKRGQGSGAEGESLP